MMAGAENGIVLYTACSSGCSTRAFSSPHKTVFIGRSLNSNQIQIKPLGFQIKCFVVKSNYRSDSRFKSNHDLDFFITTTDMIEEMLLISTAIIVVCPDEVRKLYAYIHVAYQFRPKS